MLSQSGFTLIELIISFVIFAILFTISITSINHFYSTSQQNLLRKQLLQALYFARDYAQAKHLAIGLCASKNSRQCLRLWNNRLIIFVDNTEKGIIQLPQQIVHIFNLPTFTGKLYWRSFPIYREYVLFSSYLSAANGTFWYCDAKKFSPQWAIVINRVGRIRQIYPDKNGVIKDGSGKVLECQHSMSSRALSRDHQIRAA
jgi:type IV fimbrial biogenesis protein FimT